MRGNTYQSLVTNELASEPEERLLEVVIRLGRNIIILQVFLAMESNRLGLDFAFLDVDFVAAEDDGDVLADTDEVTCFKQKTPVRKPFFSSRGMRG